MKTKIISAILLSQILFTGCDDNSTEPSPDSATISSHPRLSTNYFKKMSPGVWSRDDRTQQTGTADLI